jgi:hypothetical protein
MQRSKEAARRMACWLFFLFTGCAEVSEPRSAMPAARDPSAATLPPDLPKKLASKEQNASELKPAAHHVPAEASPTPAKTGEKAGGYAQLPEDPSARLRALHRLAEERYASFDSYIARVKRRELVNGKQKPEEVYLFKYRKQPLSLYFKWIGTEAQGREVIYVQGQHENKIHTLLAAGDNPLMPAGSRMALSPDSVLVRSQSRHSITEAGIGNIIELFGKALDAADKGDTSQVAVKYTGTIKRPEFDSLLEGAERTIPAGLEPQLPRGGKRLVMFEPTSRLPLLVITSDHSGQEVEYYCYDRMEFPVHLDSDDFDPEKLWKKKGN